MVQRVRWGVVGLVAAMLIGIDVGGASAASTGAYVKAAEPVQAGAEKRAGRRPVLKVSAKEVNEGDRVTLRAIVKSPARATRVTLQKFRLGIFGDPIWEPVKAAKTRGRRKVAFKVVATGENRERYRVTVAYRKVKRVVVSKPIAVTIWRWIPLSAYSPYYETRGVGFGTPSIDGRVYNGWGAAYYSHLGSWEARFTPGRHCTSFKAVLGVGDISGDGSSGQIAFTADDTPVYTSPVLTPGMNVSVTVSLARPYRFGIQLSDTTPGGTSGGDEVESWPVLGEPAFLCTGV